MKVQTGHLYHIKDEFFDKINEKQLMINHENAILDHHIWLLKIKNIMVYSS